MAELGPCCVKFAASGCRDSLPMGMAHYLALVLCMFNFKTEMAILHCPALFFSLLLLPLSRTGKE